MSEQYMTPEELNILSEVQRNCFLMTIEELQGYRAAWERDEDESHQYSDHLWAVMQGVKVSALQIIDAYIASLQPLPRPAPESISDEPLRTEEALFFRDSATGRVEILTPGYTPGEYVSAASLVPPDAASRMSHARRWHLEYSIGVPPIIPIHTMERCALVPAATVSMQRVFLESIEHLLQDAGLPPSQREDAALEMVRNALAMLPSPLVPPLGSKEG